MPHSNLALSVLIVVNLVVSSARAQDTDDDISALKIAYEQARAQKLLDTLATLEAEYAKKIKVIADKEVTSGRELSVRVRNELMSVEWRVSILPLIGEWRFSNGSVVLVNYIGECYDGETGRFLGLLEKNDEEKVKIGRNWVNYIKATDSLAGYDMVARDVTAKRIVRENRK